MIELEIQEMNDNLSKDCLPVYYKYRYTFTSDEDTIQKQIEMTKRLLMWIKDHYLLGDKIVAGVEHYTKGMLPAKPHVHIHFMSRKSSDTIRKGIAHRFDLIGKCQSCKPEVLVDEAKFWRYPLKQQQGDTEKYYNVKGFDADETKNMIEISYACWKQSAEILVNKLEKKLERSTKDRLFTYLDTLSEKSEKTLVRAAYEYYVENEDTFNVTTVNGYIHIYLLKNKIVSYQDFIDKYYKCV